MQAFRNASTRVKLAVAFGMLVVAVIAMVAVVLGRLGAIRDEVQLNSESAQIIRLSHVAEKGLIRVNSQMRGILLTGNFAYLDTFNEGSREFRTGLAALSQLVTGPEQRQLVQAAIVAGADWQRHYGRRLVEMARTPAGRRAATRVLVADGEKVRVTYITRMIARARTIEEARIGLRERHQHRAIILSFVVLSVGGLLVIGLALLMAAVVSRGVAQPLAALTDTVTSLAAGDYAVTVAERDRRRGDEIGRIARAVETFRVNAVAKARLETETRTLREAAATEARAAIERSARELERDQLTIGIIARGLAAIADGDLTARLAAGLPDNAASLRTDFDTAAGQLEQLLHRVRTTAASVNRSAGAIAEAATLLATRTGRQADGMVSIRERLEAVTGTVQRNAASAQAAAEITTSARRKAESSGAVVAGAVAAMARIELQAEQITGVTHIVEAIGRQTSMLALNALLEAARAGESAQGFAVVAKEVSVLAQRLRGAAGDIRASMAVTQGCVAEGVALVGDAGKAFQAIVVDVSAIADLTGAMALAARGQATTVDEISHGVRGISELIAENAAMAGNTRSAGGELTAGARLLRESVERFRIGAHLG